MDLQLGNLVVLDHLAVFKTEVAIIFGGLGVHGLEHAHGLEGVELLLGQLHHLHLVNQIFIHLVQFLLQVLVFCHDVDSSVSGARLKRYACWGLPPRPPP